MQARVKRREMRRAELLEAAMGIVVEDGFEALTIAHLARRVGLAVGAMYRYFDGKDALIAALQTDAIDEFAAFLAQHGADTTAAMADVAERPRALAHVVMVFVAYLDDARSAPRRHRLVDAFLSSPSHTLSDEGARGVEAALKPIYAAVEARFADAVKVGALAPGDDTVRTFVGWAAIHGLDHFRKRDRIVEERLQVAALLPATFSALLAAWGASEADLTAAMSAVSREIQRSAG